jgi:PAS domain S-box-containing protein
VSEAASAQEQSQRPDAWRVPVLNRLSGVLTLALLGLLGLHLYERQLDELLLWDALASAMTLAVMVAALWRSGPYRLRAFLLLGAVFSIEFLGATRYGYMIGTVLFALVGVGLSALLLGKRWAIGGWAVSTAVLLGASVGVWTGWFETAFDPASVDPRVLATGVRVTIAYGGLSALLTLGVYTALDRLTVSLRESRQALAQATSARSETARAEVDKRSAEAQFRSLVENAPDSIAIVDRQHRVVFANHQLASANPIAVGSLAEDLVAPEFAALVREHVDQVFATGEPLSYDIQVEDPERGRVWYSSRVGPIVEEGRIDRVLAVTTDISGRLDLEEQLRQAQKLEAVGQLTGGVAHDFNNLLTVILGNLQLVESELPERDPSLAFVDRARAAARRGSALTHRLLAFAAKQSLQPRVVDVGELVAGMGDLLRRTLGETIAVHTLRADGLWKCRVDPTQLENVILNLAINARDAMRGGGSIEIETHNVEVDASSAQHSGLGEGSYVMLSLTDAGSGMAPEILEHVFEPFFTTKGVGRGSGLGLSMVYGFVKQSDGRIEIESRPDEGTCVRIHLPRALAAEPAHEVDLDRAAPEENAVSKGAGELILVVEDDESVRSLTVHLLERIGYKTVEAANGARALALLERASDVALVFTDVVLPGDMSGVQLGRALARLRPSLPVLYTSGYMANALGSRGLGPDDDLLVKPFTPPELAEKIREALGGSKQAGS